MIAIKQEAINLIKNIPDNENLSWDDIMYEFYVRQKIELGLKDIEDGNTYTLDEAEKILFAK